MYKHVPTVELSALKAGDIVLVREAIDTAVGSLDPGVARGVLSTTDGAYFTVKKQSLKSWTHTGLCVQYRDRALLVEATLAGIEAFPLQERVRHYQETCPQVAARCFVEPPTDHMNDVLTQLAEAALSGCRWGHFHAPSSHRVTPRNKGGDTAGAAASAAGAGGVGGSRPTPFACDVVRALLPRVWSAVSELPAQVELELCRSFAMVDQGNTGHIELKEVRDVLAELRGGKVSTQEAKAMMTLMDANKDGQVSMQEFIDTLAKRPLTRVPVEHDLATILSGEFAALMLEIMGLLPRDSRSASAQRAAALAKGGTVAATARSRAAELQKGTASMRKMDDPVHARKASQLAPTPASPAEGFAHFTPHTFSSYHQPPLALTRGRLGPESFVDTGLGDPRPQTVVRALAREQDTAAGAFKLSSCCESRKRPGARAADGAAGSAGPRHMTRAASFRATTPLTHSTL